MPAMNSTATLPAPLHRAQTLPGALPLIGVLPQIQKDPLGLMERATLQHGPVAHLPFIAGLNGYMLGTPKLAHHVLVANVKNYVKQTRGYEMLRLVLGNGLVTSEGEFWKRQRRIAQPAFHRERLTHFGAVMVRAAHEMVDRWRPGQAFDLSQEMMHVTLRIVGETLLSADVTSDADTVGVALTVALEHLIHRTLHPLSPPEWLPTPGNARFKKAVAALDEVVLGLIAERRRTQEKKPDLLAMLMESVDPESGEGMTDAQLRDEVMTIFLAGHETTANTLAWTVMLLGQAPEVMRRAVAEVDAVVGARPVTMEDLPKLPYIANVVKESLRLYPPVWSLGRRVVEDDVVEGYLLPKDALVFLSPYALHRLPEYWPDPLAFDPTRWETEDPRRAHGSYLPFSLGQRKCIGDTFALFEAQLILVTMLQRMHLSLVPGQALVPEPVITLRPKNGIHVTARGR